MTAPSRAGARGSWGWLAPTAAAVLVRGALALGTGAFTPPRAAWDWGYEVGAVGLSLVEGRGFADPFLVPTGPTAAVSPVAPLAWAAAQALGGVRQPAAWRLLVALELVLSAAVVPLAWRLGRRVGGDGERGATLAVVAAWGWALHPFPALACTGYLGSLGLFTVAVPFALERLLWLESGPESRVRSVACAGAALGAATWVEPLLLPFVGLRCAWNAVRGRRRAAVDGALTLALALAIVAPWTLRNLVVLDAFVPFRSWGGPELLLGALAGPGEPTPVGWHPTRSPDELQRMRDVGEIAYVREKRDEALARIRERPARWLAAVAWRDGNFWLGRLSWWRADARQPLAPGRLAALRGVAVLGPTLLAAAGLLSLHRRGRGRPAGFLLLLFAVYPLTYAVTHVEARYRLPVEPAVVVAAAAALEALLATRRRDACRPEGGSP